MNYKKIIQKGFPLIDEWMLKQNQNIKDSTDFKELLRVCDEIFIEQDFSKDAYEDIRYVLKPFNNSLPLQIKRIFNISTLDNYTAFLSSRWFENINDFVSFLNGKVAIVVQFAVKSAFVHFHFFGKSSNTVTFFNNFAF